MQQSTPKTKTVMISFSKSGKVVLKIIAEANPENADALAFYLKELKVLPSLEKIYKAALTFAVGTEENLIVMSDKLDKKGKHEYIFKGEGMVNELESIDHTFHKSSVNPVVRGGIADDSYMIPEYLE